MRKLAFFLCSALLVFGAEDPWAKLKGLKTGTELRVYKKGAAAPVVVKMDELTDDNLVVIDKKEQTAIPRDQIDRVDARPTGKTRMTTESSTKVNDGVGDPRSVIPAPNQGSPGQSTSTSSNVSFGGKPDFETVYRRSTGGAPKK